MDIFAEHSQQYQVQQNERIRICELLLAVADEVGSYVRFGVNDSDMDINPGDSYNRAGQYRSEVWYPLQSSEIPPGDSARRQLFERLLGRKKYIQVAVYHNGIVWLDADLEVVA